ISTGVMVMGQVVAMVRETVRDLVAELVGKLISWVLEEACTLGFATPLVAAQATTAITSTITKVSELVRKLLKTIGNVTPKIRRIVDKLGEIIEKLAKLGKKFARRADGATTPSAAHSLDTPQVHSPDAPHAPDTPDGADLPGASHPGDGTTPGSLKESSENPKTESREQECVPGSGDPIDVATGQMFSTEIDAELPGVLPLVFERTHYSSYRAGTWFGPSWTSTVDQRVEVEDDGIHFAAADGMRLVYPVPLTDGAEVLPIEGPRWPLTRTAEGYRITRLRDGCTLDFPGTTGRIPLATITDRGGRRIEFHYDETGAPAEIRHSGGYRLGIDTEGRRVTRLWLHNVAGEPITLMRYAYDDRGRLTEVVNSSNQATRFGYDLAGRITQWTDRNGEWYRYHFDGRGRCVRTEGSGGALTGTWDYDEENRVTIHTNSLGEATAHHLNELGQVVREVGPLGGETVREWDRHDRLLSITDPLGRTTRYTWDERGNLLATTLPDGTQRLTEYNELNLPTVLVDADGAVWRQDYDEAGNLVAVTDPVGAVTRYSYGESGFLTAVTDAHGQVRRIETDAAGLPLTVPDPSGVLVRCRRDQFGRLVEVADPAGGVVRLEWTVEGRLLSRTTPDGVTERWVHDGEGNEIRHVDPLGRVTTVETTHFDLVAAQILPDGSRYEFGYDTELKPVSVRNPQGLVWRYEYDRGGNLVRETDFDGRTTTYEHDAAGQVVARTNGAGETVRLVRDPLGRVAEEQFPDGTRATFTYDPVGRLVRAVNANAELVLGHDPIGRVVSETVNGRTVTSRYDALGRRTHRRTPTGAESAWSYDAEGRPTELRCAGRTLTFGYDAAGREVERLLDTGTILAQSWDGNNQLTTQTVSAVSRTAPPRVVQSRQYRYRPDGSIAEVEDLLSGVRRFEFDAASRLTGVQRNGYTERYNYDAAGNITGGAWPSADRRGQGPREYRGTLVERAGNVRYRYDGHGRLAVREAPGESGPWRYSWDAGDRLTAVTTPDGTVWRYSYDPMGRRIAKERLAPDGRTVVERVDFTWDGVTLAEEVRDGTSATTWNWGAGLRALTQTERLPLRDAPQQWVDQQFDSIVTDLVGSPAELVDPLGTVAWHNRGSVWGEQPAGGTPLRFPGQYFDAETGLHYNLFRYYDPSLGRYSSADPLGLGGGPNPYSYVPNPLQWIDPFGLKKCDPRDQPGTAHGSAGIPDVDGQWRRGSQRNAARFPGQVARQLEGRHFNNFDEFREAFWREVHADPNLRSQFPPGSQGNMANGHSPFVVDEQTFGGRSRYELHHVTPIQHGGGVYDMRNIVIVTPRYHRDILDPRYHYGNG
ncbi:type IV secretion protein Rhs, partial [Amycolatopsis bartoniae]